MVSPYELIEFNERNHFITERVVIGNVIGIIQPFDFLGLIASEQRKHKEFLTFKRTIAKRQIKLCVKYNQTNFENQSLCDVQTK